MEQNIKNQWQHHFIDFLFANNIQIVGRLGAIYYKNMNENQIIESIPEMQILPVVCHNITALAFGIHAKLRNEKYKFYTKMILSSTIVYIFDIDNYNLKLVIFPNIDIYFLSNVNENSASLSIYPCRTLNIDYFVFKQDAILCGNDFPLGQTIPNNVIDMMKCVNKSQFKIYKQEYLKTKSGFIIIFSDCMTFMRNYGWEMIPCEQKLPDPIPCQFVTHKIENCYFHIFRNHENIECPILNFATEYMVKSHCEHTISVDALWKNFELTGNLTCPFCRLCYLWM